MQERNIKIKDSNKLFEVEIPDFITKIKVSESRRAIYYEQYGKHEVGILKTKHIKPLGKCLYEWKDRKVGTKKISTLYYTDTDTPVIKNPRTIGTPKYLPIAGNVIYSGRGGFINRMTIIDGIKENFYPFFKEKDKIKTFPIHLVFTMHNELLQSNSKGKSKSQDLDNCLSIYIKASQDLMKRVGIIPDDDLRYIRSTSYEFIDSKKKKLVITAYKY